MFLLVDKGRLQMWRAVCAAAPKNTTAGFSLKGLEPDAFETQTHKKKLFILALNTQKKEKKNPPQTISCDVTSPPLPHPSPSSRERERRRDGERLIDSWRRSWAKWTWRERPKESRWRGRQERRIKTKQKIQKQQTHKSQQQCGGGRSRGDAEACPQSSGGRHKDNTGLASRHFVNNDDTSLFN